MQSKRTTQLNVCILKDSNSRKTRSCWSYNDICISHRIYPFRFDENRARTRSLELCPNMERKAWWAYRQFDHTHKRSFLSYQIFSFIMANDCGMLWVFFKFLFYFFIESVRRVCKTFHEREEATIFVSKTAGSFLFHWKEILCDYHAGHFLLKRCWI